MAQLPVEVVEVGLEKADQDLARLGRTAAQTEKAVNSAGGSFSKNRAIIQQFGFQLQDVVVTTRDAASGLTALGVQGGQFLSFMNPVAGTLLTIAGVAGGALLNSLTSATNETNSLADALDALDETLRDSEDGAKILSRSLLDLAEKSKELARAELVRTMIAANDAMRGAGAAARDLIDSDIGGWFSDGTAQIDRAYVALQGFKESGEDASAALDRINQGGGRVTGSFAALSAVVREIQNDFGLTRDQAISLAERLGEVSKNADSESIKALTEEVTRLSEESGFSNTNLNNLQSSLAKVGIQALSAAEAQEFATRALKDFDAALKESDVEGKEDEARGEAEKARIDARVAREREAEQRRLEIRQQSAAQMLSEIDRLGASESEKLDYWYTDQNARLTEALNERLITQQEYATASALLTEELLARQAQLEDDANAKRRAAENQRTAEVKAQVEAQYEAEDKRKRAFQDSVSAATSSIGTITQALRDGGKEQSAAYKILFAAQQAAAIPTIITAAETGAAQALALGPLGIPIAAVIKALGYASAGVVAGQAISGMRMQGGQVFAGRSYEVGERGREVFTPSTNGVISSSGSGAMAVNLKVIDNSTGSKTYSARQLTETDVELIIEDRVPRIMAREQADPYSQFSKAQRTTTSATRRL